jgi:hypothetical protein
MSEPIASSMDPAFAESELREAGKGPKAESRFLRVPDRYLQGAAVVRETSPHGAPLPAGPDHCRRGPRNRSADPANSAAKALGRFANLVLRGNPQMTYPDIEAEIGEAVDYVVHVEREPQGRVIRQVLRVIGYDRRAQRFETDYVFPTESQPFKEAIAC